jgi:lipid A 3-O-deacylase
MIIKHKIFIISLFLVFKARISNAQESSYKSEFGFISDNDSYLAQGQDRYYTNGLFLKFRSALDQSALKNPRLNKVIWELEAGQKMFNPQTGSILDPAFIDRPFAAYLYGGGAVQLSF